MRVALITDTDTSRRLDAATAATDVLTGLWPLGPPLVLTLNGVGDRPSGRACGEG